jgi:hypothetical protein
VIAATFMVAIQSSASMSACAENYEGSLTAAAADERRRRVELIRSRWSAARG